MTDVVWVCSPPTVATANGSGNPKMKPGQSTPPSAEPPPPQRMKRRTEDIAFVKTVCRDNCSHKNNQRSVEGAGNPQRAGSMQATTVLLVTRRFGWLQFKSKSAFLRSNRMADRHENVCVGAGSTYAGRLDAMVALVSYHNTPGCERPINQARAEEGGAHIHEPEE